MPTREGRQREWKGRQSVSALPSANAIHGFGETNLRSPARTRDAGFCWISAVASTSAPLCIRALGPPTTITGVLRSH